MYLFSALIVPSNVRECFLCDMLDVLTSSHARHEMLSNWIDFEGYTSFRLLNTAWTKFTAVFTNEL